MPSIYSQYTNMANFNILITNNVEKKRNTKAILLTLILFVILQIFLL